MLTSSVRISTRLTSIITSFGTALDEQRKFRNFWGSTRAVRRLNDTICVENGYSIVADPKGRGQAYDKWLGDQKKPSHRERICYAVDEALAQNPQGFEALLELLRQSGYQVKYGKVPSLLGKGQKRFIRMDTLGENYTPDALRAIISGTRSHTPKKKRGMDVSTKPSGSLLLIFRPSSRRARVPVMRGGRRTSI